MPSSLQDFLVSLTYPPTLSICMLLCGGLMLLRWRRLGGLVMVLAVGWSALWSVPQCSDWLRGTLEERHPVVVESTLPPADAIVVLGGGVGRAWLRREDVDPEELKSSRLAAGARAWLARRAPTVILSGGGDGDGSEARTMAAAITRLRVPASALLLEERSRDTRGNALFTAELAKQHGMRRVLLVTSALHMPRARLMFCEAGMEVTPIPVPEFAHRDGWRARWLPTRGALWRSGRALKEYAGLAAVFIEMKMNDDGQASRRCAMNE
jgi:uncharacterized SAM-binding protein YcdF (DUF218 family)